MKIQDLSECQYYKERRSGDNLIEWCELSDHVCMLSRGYECEDGNEIKGEN